MNQETMKKALCEAHTELLRIILYFGGYMLLAQLRALCLALGLYSTAQAVDRGAQAVNVLFVFTHIAGVVVPARLVNQLQQSLAVGNGGIGEFLQLNTVQIALHGGVAVLSQK